MTIKNLIIHSAQREKDGEQLKVDLRKDVNLLLDANNKPIETTMGFAEALIELFANTNSDVGEFGVNGDNTIEPPFEQKLNQFYPGGNKNSFFCSDFVALTRDLTTQYSTILSKPSLQTVKGGILVFVQYETRSKDCLAVAVLNKAEGYDSSSTLDVVPREILDLSKLNQAATINLTQWQANLTNRYVKFKAGSRTQLRDYFEEFIGCQRDKGAAKLETKKLKEAVQKFGIDPCKYSDEEISERVGRAHDFIKQQQKDGNPVFLSELANYVFPDRSEEFFRTAQNNYELSEELAIDNGTLRTYKKISAKGNGFSITFDRELVGKDIHLTDDGGLTLNPEVIPDTLRKQIQEELDERQAKDKP